jgi:hypothetical protein
MLVSIAVATQMPLLGNLGLRYSLGISLPRGSAGWDKEFLSYEVTPLPQSMTIAAFVFGAVLLLIALLGGGFKIFGAEVSGKAGAFGRPIAGVTGMILLILGLFGSSSLDKSTSSPASSAPMTTTTMQPVPSNTTAAQTESSSKPAPVDNTAAERTKQKSEAPTSQVQPSDERQPNYAAQTHQQEPQPDETPNIAGMWRDPNTGALYQIYQRGNSFSARSSWVGGAGQGTGRLHGLNFDSTYQNDYANGARSTGRCSGTIFPNASQITVTCFDSIYGQSSTVIVR